MLCAPLLTTVRSVELTAETGSRFLSKHRRSSGAPKFPGAETDAITRHIWDFCFNALRGSSLVEQCPGRLSKGEGEVHQTLNCMLGWSSK